MRLIASPWPRLLVLGLLAGAAVRFWVTAGPSALEAARDDLAGLGVVGVLGFVGLYAVATVALFPVSVLSAAAGVLFGPVLGAATVWAGAMLGAGASFALGRVLTRPALERIAGARLDRLNTMLGRRGLPAVLLVRLVPLFPFTAVNYGSAVTAVSVRDYLLGTGLGIVPGIVVYVALGGTLDRPLSPGFLAALGGFVLLSVGGTVLARRLRRGQNPGRAEPAERTRVHRRDRPGTGAPVSTEEPVDAVEVYWRPGCWACRSLLGGLSRRGLPIRAINLSEQPDAAERLRTLTRGDDTVPTVVVGDHVMINPKLERVEESLRWYAPQLYDQTTPVPRRGWLRRRRGRQQ